MGSRYVYLSVGVNKRWNKILDFYKIGVIGSCESFNMGGGDKISVFWKRFKSLV